MLRPARLTSPALLFLLALATCAALPGAASAQDHPVGLDLMEQGEEGGGERQVAAAGPYSPLIVGGSPTTINSAPYQVALVFDGARFFGNDFDRAFCGGSLIAPRDRADGGALRRRHRSRTTERIWTRTTSTSSPEGPSSAPPPRDSASTS